MCTPPLTCGFLIQLVFCKTIHICGLLVLVTPILSGVPPPKKNSGSASDHDGKDFLCFYNESPLYITLTGVFQPNHIIFLHKIFSEGQNIIVN